MKKKVERASIITAGISRLPYECKTILRLSSLYGLIGVMLFSAGCNPSSPTTINHNNIQPDSKASQRETQLTGGTTGGAGDGGGGQGVLCSDETADTNIKGKLLVRDIYEAIKNHNRTMPSTKLGPAGTAELDDASIEHLVKVLNVYFGPASPRLIFATTDYWKKFAKHISFIADDATIHASQDANSPLALPNGCKIVQIAFWDESSGPNENGTLWVDRAKWIQLDQFNKIALLAHEFFFKQARTAGHKNSDFVRYKVGQLLSDTGLAPVFRDWVPSTDPRISNTMPAAKNGFKVCSGTSETDPSAELLMYQYEGSDKLQHIVFPIMSSRTLNISDLQVPHITFSAEKNKDILGITNLLVPTTHYKDNLFNLYDPDAEVPNTSKPELLRQIKISHRYNQQGGYILERETWSIPGYIAKILSGEDLKYNFSDVKWTIPSQINSKSMTIILNNPIIKDRGSSLIPKSRENLINLAYNYSRNLLVDLQGRLDGKTIATNALIVLDKEIDAMISRGKYKHSFPLWEEQVKRYGNMEPGMFEDNKSPETKQRALETQVKNARDAARALYLLKTNTYSTNEIETLLRTDLSRALEKDQAPVGAGKVHPIKVGSLSFLQGEEKLTFTLSCEDYFDDYKVWTHRKAYSDEVEQIVNKNIQTSINEITYFSKTLTDYDDVLDTAKAFAEFLTTKNIIAKKDLISCRGYNRDPILCQDANSFFVDMQDEDSVDFSHCGGGIDVFQAVPKCTIMKLKKSNQKYLALIYFERDKSGKIDRSKDPTISYILRVP